MDASPTVVVLGSVNTDIVVVTDHLPAPGETILAAASRRTPGGKGGNQAVAVARAGGVRTLFVGAVGSDPDGGWLRASLCAAGVNDACLASLEGPSGVALITVDSAGENTIVVAQGANARLAADPGSLAAVAEASAVLAQLEVPQATLATLASARRPGTPFLLNAAPAAPLDEALAAQVDVLVVNEGEALTLADAATLDAALAVLVGRFPAVVVTLGAAGSELHRRGSEPVRVAAPRVVAVDSVAAGDTYAGVLAAELALGAEFVDAIRRASAAASLAVERPGAQESVPSRDEVERRVRQAYG